MEKRLTAAVLVGSLRKASFTRCSRMAPASLSCENVEIRDLPLYNEDAEATRPPPEQILELRSPAPMPCCS